MAQPYVGEIRMFAGNFAPAGWMFCEGQLLPISENETLFQLIGTTYGGDGESTFALPDLRGRIPIHQGNGFILAETGGAEEITLTVQQIPAHTPPAAGVRQRRRRHRRRGQRARPSPSDECSPTSRRAAASATGARARSARRRKPAAHQLPAVPVRRLHHLAVRHLPQSPTVRDARARWPIRSSPRSGSSRSTSPRRAGRGATGSCCRSRRTPRSSRCSAPPTAATARATSRCRTSGRAPMHPGRGRAVAARPRRDRWQRDRDAARERDPVALARPECARRADGNLDDPAGAIAARHRRTGTCPRYRGRRRLRTLAPRRWRPPAATSRTTTCSRT